MFVTEELSEKAVPLFILGKNIEKTLLRCKILFFRG